MQNLTHDTEKGNGAVPFRTWDGQLAVTVPCGGWRLASAAGAILAASNPRRLVLYRGGLSAMADVIRIAVKLDDDGPIKTFRGRFAQTLDLLVKNSRDGLTSLESPGVRLSHYIHILRRDGVPIETEDERHSGPYSGRHGRYRLTAPVTIIEREVAHG